MRQLQAACTQPKAVKSPARRLNAAVAGAALRPRACRREATWLSTHTATTINSTLRYYAPAHERPQQGQMTSHPDAMCPCCKWVPFSSHPLPSPPQLIPPPRTMPGPFARPQATHGCCDEPACVYGRGDPTTQQRPSVPSQPASQLSLQCAPIPFLTHPSHPHPAHPTPCTTMCCCCRADRLHQPTIPCCSA